METYAFLSRFAQGAGVLYFMTMFLFVLVYALWPGNRDKFDHAARAPLRED